MASATDWQRILLGRSLRAFADGYVAILLPLHLSILGFEAFAVGAISTATLLGSALLTLVLGTAAHRVRRRPALLAAALLMATGSALPASRPCPLLLIAFIGTLNPSGGDVSVFLPLEHTVLAHTVPDRDRTAMFARYSFAGAVLGAFGALAAGIVDWFAPAIPPRTTINLLFILYGLIGLLTFVLYRGLSPQSRSATATRRLRSARRVGGSTALPRSFRWTPSVAGWSSTHCSRSGSTSASACPSRRPARSFSPRSSVRRCHIPRRAACATVRPCEHDGVHAPCQPTSFLP